MFCLQGKIIFSYLVAKKQFFFLKTSFESFLEIVGISFVVLLYDQQGVPSVFFQMLLLSISMAPVGVLFGEVSILGHSSLFIDMLPSAKKNSHFSCYSGGSSATLPRNRNKDWLSVPFSMNYLLG